MRAHSALLLLRAYSAQCFPDDAVGMETHVVGTLEPLLGDRVSYGTHKYIPADKLSADIGAARGAGVFAYYRFEDGSYLLLTCHHGLALWSGKDEDSAVVPPRVPPRPRKLRPEQRLPMRCG